MTRDPAGMSNKYQFQIHRGISQPLRGIEMTLILILNRLSIKILSLPH